MSNPPIKQEPNTTPPATSTTIGGAVRAKFEPKIPSRRKGANDGAAASSQASSQLRDLITTKVEHKPQQRLQQARPQQTAAPVKVAFMPSAGAGGSGSMASGEEQRDVSVLVSHQSGAKIPGQQTESETSAAVKAAAAATKAAKVKKEVVSTGDPVQDQALAAAAEAQARADAEALAEAEYAALVDRESAYDSFLDNGDPRQYRPIVLPFPRVRLPVQGAAVRPPSIVPPSSGVSRSASPMAVEATGAFGAAASMFDDLEDLPMNPAAAAAALPSHLPLSSVRQASPVASSSSNSAPYKALPLHTPARLLGQIDHEEKTAPGGAAEARNILFFQFPSHLPFKQTTNWTPPVNPLLTLNGQRQSSLGTNTSAITFGANTNDVTHSSMAQATRHLAVSGAPAATGLNPSNLLAPSPSLKALHDISSPALPSLHPSGGMPNLSLGGSHQSAASAAMKAKKGPGASNTPMDEMATSSALATEEEVDLGEIDANKISESERLAREHKARQQRKLLLFSSNFEHAMRHLPSGQLGELMIYKSGKIKMKIGEILLDVNEGVECLFHQELMSVQASTGEAFRLGNVKNRLVCTNDVLDLVRKTRERAPPPPDQ